MSRSADLDSGNVRKGHRRDDLETTWIDDAQHRIACRRFDQIARVVLTLDDDTVKRGAHGRAPGNRFGRAQ